MRISRPKLQTAEMDMTPMIDVTFQLIAFFMFVLNFSDVDIAQEINLPLSELAKPPDSPYSEPLTVQMTKQDTILFGGVEMSMDGLQGALSREAQIIRAHPTKKTSDVTVIIRADKQIRAGRVQEVIELCQKAEFDTFALRGKQSQATATVE